MSFHHTHNPYFTPTQRHIPPLCCSFPRGSRSSPLGLASVSPFPHFPVTWYPWWRFSFWPNAKWFSIWVHGPANIKFPKEIGARPLMFGGSHRLTHMFFCWCFSVFSLNTILSSSRFPARSPTDHIYSAVSPIYSFSVWNLDFTWNWKSWISHMYIQY